MTSTVDVGSASVLIFILLTLVGITIIAIDLVAMIIPDMLNIFVGILGLFAATHLPSGHPVDALLGGFTGGVLTAGVRIVHMRRRGAEGLGLGDVKFAMAAGFWTGVYDFPFFLLTAALAGLAYVVTRRIFGLRLKGADRIPFGPFLVLSLAIIAGIHLFANVYAADMLTSFGVSIITR